LHCFLQASTTAFHVVEALHNGRFGRGSVIHTNSFAVPYLLLGKGRDHSSFFSVYPISGDVKDYLCDGWLYTSNDQVANTYVRSLFERPHYRIQKVFLTPQFVDVEGKCYFGREETIPLFETALEMAEEVVVLTPGPRILPDRRLLPSNSQISWSESRIRRNGKTKALNWVVGGETKSLTADGKEQFLATCKSLSSDVAWV